MQRKSRRSSPPVCAKALTALAVAAAFSNASAAGLGKLTVLSALGQPLRAEIELTSVSSDEADSLVAKLASVNAFKQANVDFNPALMTMRFAVEQRGSRQIIRVNSSQPINEPYVGMLIELASSKGRLVREYTFLLDPADIRQAQTAPIAAPIAVSELPSSAQSGASAQPSAAVEKSRPSRKTQKLAAKKDSAEGKATEGKVEYRVKAGDTLGSIAGKHKHDGVSLDQMLVSIYRTNPDAFIGNNMNRLKSGRVMTIPDAATAGSVSSSEARSVILAQSSDFDQYRHKLAGSVVKESSQAGEQAAQTDSGKVTAKVTEKPTAASKSVDRLKLSKETAAVAEPQKSAGVVSTEDKLSRDKSSADTQARIRELEQNIKELQGLLELKNKDLSVQQKQADQTVAAKAPEAQAATSAAAPAAAVTPQPAPEAKPKPKVVPPPPPPPQPSFLDELLDNTTMLGGIAAAVLGLGYLLWNNIRRKKKTQEISEKFLVSEPLTETPNSLFGTTGGQSVNTNNSIFNSSFTPSASQLDANEVDPVAEADVYIAYGREAQAIEILKDALRVQPERNVVRIKLLEIYAGQNDVLAFDTLASDLYALTKGEGEDWAYAAKMGASIDPKNPLYTDVDMLEEIGDKPVSLHAMTNPMAELDPDSLMAPSRLTEEPSVSATQAEEAQQRHVDQDMGSSADLPLDIFGGEVSPVSAVESNEAADQEFGVTQVAVRAEEPAVSAEVSPSIDTGSSFENMIEFDLPDLTATNAASAAPEIDEQIVVKPIEELSLELQQMMSSEELPENSQPQTDMAAVSKTEEAQDELISVVSSDVAGTTAADLCEPSGEAVVVTNQLVEPAPIEFDFSSISLDIGAATAEFGNVSKPVNSDVAPMINIEMATKLDLAVAYMEIGDKEGARELLDEVIKGGDEEQVAKAKETLAKLA